MELSTLITALSDPAAYPAAVDAVEVRQTHISVVFLAGPHAYKLKKPVALGFLDFRLLEHRRHWCEYELFLNRRLAPSVYLEVVPVTEGEAGVRIEGPGKVVDWAVKMQRLPDDASLESRVRRGEVGVEHLDALAFRIASFHAGARAGPTVSAWGRFAVVAGNALENFDQAISLVGTTVARSVFDRLRQLTESALANLQALIERRAERGAPRDGHGDLRLDHVYLFPDRPPPEDLMIIDCIEFSERFRCADPVADVAFLVMDLDRLGRRDLARSFSEAYLQAAHDAEGRALLPFYTAYRASVRAKVEGITLAEPEIPEAERANALARSRAHWLQALGALEEPGRRPCLVLVGGLPGAGKSTLARGLAGRAGFIVIRSDVVRKERVGERLAAESPAPLDEGIYTLSWTERTYADCLRQAEARLFEGDRVLVDASFRREAHRRLFLEAAGRCGVPVLLLICRAAPEVVRARLDRRRDDASDADWSIHLHAAGEWEEPGPPLGPAIVEIVTDGGESEALDRALDALREQGLVDADGPAHRDQGP